MNRQRRRIITWQLVICALCLIGLLTVILLSSRRVTQEATLRAFDALPFQDSQLVWLAVEEYDLEICHQFVVEAVYYDSQTFQQTVTDAGKMLDQDGWQLDSQDMEPETQMRHVSYIRKNREYLSISPDRTPIFPKYTSRVVISTSELVDWERLSDLENRSLGDWLGDGYFMVGYHFHPYHPNDCGG